MLFIGDVRPDGLFPGDATSGNAGLPIGSAERARFWGRADSDLAVSPARALELLTGPALDGAADTTDFGLCVLGTTADPDGVRFGLSTLDDRAEERGVMFPLRVTSLTGVSPCFTRGVCTIRGAIAGPVLATPLTAAIRGVTGARTLRLGALLVLSGLVALLGLSVVDIGGVAGPSLGLPRSQGCH